MAILIDPPEWPAHGQLWSHLVSDTSYDELHAFARELRVPRRGFDLDHYDVPARRYEQAVALGALPVPGRAVVHALRDAGLRVRQIDRDRVTPGRRLGFLRSEWARLGGLLGVPETVRHRSGWADLGDDLERRWREPHRSYHDERHLEDVLLTLDHFETLAEDVAPETLLAAWFHDAIYTGRGGVDERDSAEYAAAALRELSVGQGVGERVRELILATDPAFAGEAPPERLAHLHDADLWVFASPPERYAQYTAGVRAEYAHLAPERFRAGRAEILRGFLERPRLYRTEPAHRMWDERARENVAAEIRALTSGN
ncbi:DUF4031 domain-containing protein [Leucobacter sp. M11]|uniref:DUF4031 domain-containing protein n=1 Tax=Leucobacter sp. M11 TaxID=2993565 RepID=UPI002D80A0AE|nr:DUF4031 domain-containing protein [Leucobacter sp. M11]MEB4613314.1 DUF4031 domain-containing protein [Leucobacter sp. M11]